MNETKESGQSNKYNFIIIGGGICGTTCAQKLALMTYDANPKPSILLLSATPLVKAAINVKAITKFLNSFDIEEKSPNVFTTMYNNLTILHKLVSDLNTENHEVICDDGSKYSYDKLCICSGGTPRLISEDEYVIGIRDVESVTEFQSRIKNARQVVIVGNGGIATELTYEIENCKVIWAIKDSYISHMFFDAHSAKFFETRINSDKVKSDDDQDGLVFKRTKYTISKFDMKSEENRNNIYGSALGPDWSLNLSIKGANKEQRSHEIKIEYNCEIKRILKREQYLSDESIKEKDSNNDWPVFVELSNGKIYGCDFIISATGVVPNTDIFTKNNKFKLSSTDGGISVNDKMETSIKDVYAAGDVCTTEWDPSAHWSQMRLWTQAVQMGDYAARSMLASFNKTEIQLDFCFELFAHITKFFGFQVILLGNYNAKGLDNDYELLLRCTEGVEYVKVVVHQGKVWGALLIGETDLEETLENLILNQLDVSAYGENLINPDIDIDDYFD